ncbi:MAG: helix-turn-helix transcriptional regulator [Acutalibacteraceae bacterium]|nr:helix-turn-helix transcriptional regulator [Acutalibacteraceae bacterium]
MDDIKNTVAKNITELRLLNNMTQLELAQQLNYSDKTVSKWERGESSPDISVLVEIAGIFGVSLDYLVQSENIDETLNENKQKQTKYNRKIISYLSESIAWIVAVFAFIITSLITNKATFQWLYFVYALPVVLIVKLVFNSIWFNCKHNYFIVSALIWSILAAIHFTFLYFKINVALIYLLGVAGQIVVILWSFLKKPKIK